MAFEGGGRGPAGPDGLGRWGRVVECDGSPCWLVIAEDGSVIEPIAEFLRDFAARGSSSGSVRSYAYALLRWWRWLRRVDVAWDRATPAEVRDLVLWLGRAAKPRRFPRTGSAATAGRVNAVTGKPYLSDRYAPRTVRHSNAVIRAFYAFWMEQGAGPLVNPVMLARSPGGPGGAGREGERPHAHHNPLEPFRGEGRLRHNPSVARRRPRALSDRQWQALFTGLRHDRDRAITAVAVSSAVRAGELLGMRPVDLDWGEQLVRVVRKGSRAEQWVPASSEAFVWLRLYLAGQGTLAADGPLWWTLRPGRGPGPAHGAMLGPARQGYRPLTYPALRAVLIRANQQLGTNYTWHDFRHTAALRMSRDQNLSLRDVQTVLGHSSVATTARDYLVEDEAAVFERVARHLADRAAGPDLPVGGPAGGPAGSYVGDAGRIGYAEHTGRVGYDQDVLSVLLGEDLR